MFAGAVRETVFTRPEVIRRINAAFIPLAIRATAANRVEPAGDPAEDRLYQHLKQTQAAPQGIAVLNSGGQVLDWVLTFADEKQVEAFLDYSLRRFREHPEATQAVATRRYQQYPEHRMADLRDEAMATAIRSVHPKGQPCPAVSRGKGMASHGGLAVQVFGRALDAQGKLSPETVNQEQYAQDHFSVPLPLQKALVESITGAGTGRARLPDEFGRLCATYAYLGHLDVRPLNNPRGGSGEVKRCEFWAEKEADGKQPGLLRVEGETEVAGELAGGNGHRHTVRLTWEGFVELKENRITRLLLSARGTEKLRYGLDPNWVRHVRQESEVSFLPAGRPIDQESGVRYGMVGVPSTGSATRSPVKDVDDPEPLRDPAQQIVDLLGPRFSVFLPPVQQEMKLTAEQKDKLQELMGAAAQGVQQFRLRLAELPAEERPRQHQEFHRQASRQFGEALATLLNADQQQRLRQIALRQEGLFALGDPEVAAELEMSESQRMQFQAIMQETQRRFEALGRKAETSGNPAAVEREARQIRSEQQNRIEALLTEAQRKQWRRLLGEH